MKTMKDLKLETLNIVGNSNRPDVIFNADSGELELRGRSILENANRFYEPLDEWVKAYINSPAKKTIFKMNLEYFNTTTSKYLLTILEDLETIYDLGKEIEIHWFYSDSEMGELGEDYRNMVKMPFKFFDLS
jgi:hypothetical protein